MLKYKKIWIIGAVGSGKSTLARMLSEYMQISYYELDNLVYIRKPTGDIHRPDNKRDEIFNKIIDDDSWIIEGVYRECFQRGLSFSDCILIMDTPRKIRNRRIVTRWIKQVLKLEHSNYRPTMKMLRCMLKWSDQHDKSYNDFMDILEPYKTKIIYYSSIERKHLPHHRHSTKNKVAEGRK